MEAQYHVHRPAPPLDEFVDHFWFVADYPAPIREKLLPDGGLELILNLGEPQYLYDPVDARRDRSFRGSWISGQRTRAILIGSPARANLIGVRFGLFGACRFLPVPLNEITNRVVDADAVLGPEVHSLRDRIADANGPAEKFGILESFLLRRLREPVRHANLLARAVQSVAGATDDLGLERWAKQTGLGGKQLGRLFRATVGLSPKALFRVCRLQRAIRLIEATPVPSWSRLAPACGFYDQAHFIREFKGFTDHTPKDYLDRRGPFPNYLPQDGPAARAAG